jgi:aarF domain-containing kinase
MQLVHFVNRDSEGLAKDFVMLDFIPPGTDLGPIAHELQASFGDEETKSQLDFQVSIRPLNLQPLYI